MSTKALTRAAMRMGAVTAVSRALGFVRVLVVAAVLGTTFLGNTFQGANSVSNVLFELLAAGALSAVLVPTFVRLLDAGDADEANRLANALLGYAVIVLGVVSVAGIVGAPLIARVLASGAEDAQVAADQRELATYLLRFFVPQVMLYGFGAVATALLYARRRFAITAAAPIGNTIVMVAALVAFRAATGPDPTFDLTVGERALLVIAGTGGVIAFVATLVVAARRAGFSLRPHFGARDPAVRSLFRHSVWGVLLHANAGLLLGAAIVAGNGVAGGVVAYQVAWVFFLAPYAVLAQPIHTAILPELSSEVARGDLDAFARSTAWALDRMAVLVVPMGALMVALAFPAMSVVAFGRAADGGAELLAAGLASLAIGLYPYGAFLLLAAAYYALGDSRTPAIVALVSALVGVAVMAGLSMVTEGAARVAALGAGHTVTYVIGAVALGAGCARRAGRPVLPRALPGIVMVVVPLALAAWFVLREVAPEGRLAIVAWLVVTAATVAGLYTLAVRRWWRGATFLATPVSG